MSTPNAAERVAVRLREQPAMILGVFQRVSNMLVRMHALTVNSTRIGTL